MKICDRCQRAADKTLTNVTAQLVREQHQLYDDTEMDLCDRCLDKLQTLVRRFLSEGEAAQKEPPK